MFGVSGCRGDLGNIIKDVVGMEWLIKYGMQPSERKVYKDFSCGLVWLMGKGCLFLF